MELNSDECILITWKRHEFVRNEIKLLIAESKNSNIKADFGTNFGFLYTGYNKTDPVMMTILVYMRTRTVPISFWYRILYLMIITV